MTIQAFAHLYRVKTREDSCNEEIIPGKRTCDKELPKRMEYHNHVYDHGDGQQFGLCLLFASIGKWNHAKKRLMAAGLTLAQDGDNEGTLLLDPASEQQSRAALKEAGVKRIRQCTPAQLDAIARARARIKEQTPLRSELSGV